MSSKIGRWLGFGIALFAVVGCLLYTVKDSIQKREPNTIMGYTQWDPELVEQFGNMAIQDGGRVKPVSTWAGFELLALNGKRVVRIESGGEKIKLGPVEWALDCLFRPEFAEQMEVIQVEDSDVLDMIGMPHEKKKRRDRYSFNDIKGYLHKIDELNSEIRKNQKPGEKLDLKEEQFVNFHTNVQNFMQIYSHMAPVRDYLIKGEEADTLPEELRKFSVWVEKWPQLSQLLRAAMQDDSGKQSEGFLKLSGELSQRMERSVYSKLAFMPPTDPEQEAWIQRGGWLFEYMSFKATMDQDQLAYLKELEKLGIAYNTGGDKALTAALKDFEAKVAKLMEARNEGGSLKGEQAYYRMDYFYRSLTPFVLGFLVVAAGWLSPATRWGRVCNRIAWGLMLIGTVLVIAGVTHRSLLMGRPPVGNLYDTIPFITGVVLLILGFMEWLTKRGVCLGLALFLAVIGMFLSIWFEESKGVDTMTPLVAVLRSNFWLATHVITVTMGYAGGLLTAGLSHVYIFSRIFNIDEGDKQFRRFMTRIVYGGICFTLFFSLVGTILGGIWANDSWGRFWGWDPKENGALIIVLWCLVILHARLAGYIREWGIHICSVLGSILVAFSWWHVNFLSVGLHNYGFSGGTGMKAIWGFYWLEAFVIAVALGCAIYENEGKKLKARQKEVEHAPLD